MNGQTEQPSAAVLHAVRYMHPDKQYGFLPGMSGALPAIFGLTAESYETVVQEIDDQALSAARAIFHDSAMSGALSHLPFSEGEVVLAVGDSVTDDLCSWAHILRHVLALARPDDGITVVNAGLTAATTATVLARWPAVLAQPPDWIICALGANDAARTGPEPTKPVVSPCETTANLRRLRDAARTVHPGARWVWVPPLQVMEERVAAYPGFRYSQTSWRNDDIVTVIDAIRDIAKDSDDLLIEFPDSLALSQQPELRGPDGVHPTLSGQAAILSALLEGLTATPIGLAPAAER